MARHSQPDRQPLRAKRRRSRRGLAVGAVLVVAAFGLTPPVANAAPGDFSIDFAAANPGTYDFTTGGGAYNNGGTGSVVESLEGGDYSCGDTVTFLPQIRRDGDNPGDAPETLDIDFRFDADTTGQDGAGFIDVSNVAINYGAVSNGAGPGSTDSGIVDDGGSAASILSESLTGPPFQDGNQLLLSIRVDDLEPNEKVVVRIDVTLGCNPDASPTGTIQSSLEGSMVSASGSGNTGEVGGGAQTITLKQVGDIAFPEVSVDKTVTGTAGSCPGTQTRSVDEGDSVKYCYTVTNSGDAPLFNVTVEDDNGTPGNSADDFFVTLTGLTNEDADGQNDDLAVGASATGTATRSFASSGTVTNIATATGEDASDAPYTDTDDAVVTITGVAPSIVVTKDADPGSLPEPGGDVEFSVSIENTSGATDPITIDSLTDDIYGDLDGQGDCSVPQVIQPGDTYECAFTGAVSGESGSSHTDTVTASGADDEGTPVSDVDDAVVTITDLAPEITVVKTATPTSVPETGGSVDFTYTVTNDSDESVTITELTDDIFVEVNGDADCQIGTELAAAGDPGDSCTFTITRTITGDFGGPDHVNTFTVTAADNEGTEDTDSDDATVTFIDVLPEVSVDKTANPTSVPETGANVDFTFTVTNDGDEAGSIVSLEDSDFGTLAGDADCEVGTVLQPGESCDFVHTEFISGDASGPDHENTVTVTFADDDGNEDEAEDTETVEITDVTPEISVVKTATPTSVPETGANVDFTYTVTNDSDESVTITELTDDIFVEVNGDADCQIGTELAAAGDPGDSCTFTITRTITGDFGGPDHVNTFTVTAADNEGTEDTDSDDATVTFTDVLPDITVEKTADPTTVPETGGNVTYTVTVTNNSSEELTLDTLTDDKVDLSGVTDCDTTGVVLAPAGDPGDSFTCEYDAQVAGDEGTTLTNTATATASDNDGNSDEESDTADVTFSDVLPEVSVDKTANPTSVPETGANVDFTFTVTNDGDEAGSIVSLEDSDFGTLAGDADCEVGTVLQPGESCDFVHTEFISGDASGPDHENTVTVTFADDDGNETTDTDDETVTIIDVLPEVSVDKTANPTSVPETGANVDFTFTVTNDGDEAGSIVSLEDSDFGTLAGDADCEVGTVLQPGESCDFVHTEFISGDASGPDHENTVTVTFADDDGNEDEAEDTETVEITDVTPEISVVKTATPTSVPETGANVDFTYTVTNDSDESVTITELTDDIFVEVNGDADCQIGTELAAAGDPGDSCTFTITRTITGDFGGPDHVNTFTVTAADNEGTEDTDSDDATVTFTDVLPTVDIDKAVTPDSRPEPGGVFNYTLTITNTSLEAGTISALSDTYALSASCSALIGTPLAAGASTSCMYSQTFTDVGTYANTAEVTLDDNDGNSDSDSDSASVTVTDVLPEITVEKTANPTTVQFSGGYVTFTIKVTNNSVEPVTLTTLDDDVFGDLDGRGTCNVPQNLAVGGSYTCQFTVHLSGNAGDQHKNTVTAEANDNEGNVATDTDDATVDFSWRGRTPGYWKNHPTSWPTFSIVSHNGATIQVTTKTLVSQVFDLPSSLKSTCASGKTCVDLNKDTKPDTLLQALKYKGGSKLAGGAQTLLRAATAGLLNEAYFDIAYPPYASVDQFLDAVNTTLATSNRGQYLDLASDIDYWNNGIH